ncbi:MAG: MIP family channel protein [Acidobacteria bacterium]|nr:MIP family channel protein [Acidobacteriota bacterium]
MTTTQKALAEFIGTLALIFIGAGSICADKLTGGGVGLVGIALAHGLTIAVMVSAIGHISGGHINPAVTFGALAAKKISPREAAVYWLAQLAGGVVGAGLLGVAFDDATREAVHWGAPALAGHLWAPVGGMLVEAVLTFFLVFVVFATAIDDRGAFKAVAGFAIGMVITFDILAGGPLTGAAMNPARAFGPALLAGFWANHWVYWVGPLLGGLLAGLLYSEAFLRRR